MKFIDDKSKNLHWWNRNYFFIATLIVITINLLIFKFANKWYFNIFTVDRLDHWSEVFYFSPTLVSFFNSFSHSNWQHVLLNMLCFLVAGIYIERKKGSFSTLLLVLFGAYISGIAITTNLLNVNYWGYSGVNYFLYSYIIIDYLFSFKKSERNKFNIILGAVVVALIYLASCFNGGTSKFSFTWYPYDLMHNMAHYSSFVAGIVIGLLVQIIKLNLLILLKDKKCEDNKIVQDDENKVTKVDNATEKKVLSEDSFLSDCLLMAKELNGNQEGFTLAELVNKVVQDDSVAEEYIKSYGEKIYEVLKEEIKNGNLNAKLIVMKKGEIIVYEKIQIIKVK